MKNVRNSRNARNAKNGKTVATLSVTIKNCSMCGKAFLALPGARTCRECRLEEYRMESEVMNYVRDNPGCTMQDIMRDTGAPESLLRRLHAEGRFIEMENVTLPCKKCGKRITTGKYCRECLATMKKGLKNAVEKIEKHQTAQAKVGGAYSRGLKDDIDK